MGHIAYWRNEILKMAELEPVWTGDKGAHYRGNPEKRMPLTFDAATAADINELAADFQMMQERLVAWAGKNGNGDQPDHLVNLLLHEAYHAGQLGIIRRSLGKEGAI
jgi:hypothetical protein